MIIIDVGAGLGNQMFMYAFGRAQSLKYGDSLVLDVSAFRGDNLRSYTLDKLALTNDVLMLSDLGFEKWQYILKKTIFEMLIRITKSKRDNPETVLRYSKFGYYTSKSRKYIPASYEGKRINYYSGLFQCERYFSEYEEIIKKELKVLAPVSNKCIELAKRLNDNLSICVHVRRGDYINNELYNVCGYDYYQKSIDLMKKKVPNATYYFFSDDPSWVKSHFSGDDYVVVDMKNKDFEDLYLMYHCKHFIIPNSTFSWWAQYLSENKEKIVIAPGYWYNGLPVNATDIYMDNWLRVNP